MMPGNVYEVQSKYYLNEKYIFYLIDIPRYSPLSEIKGLTDKEITFLYFSSSDVWEVKSYG